MTLSRRLARALALPVVAGTVLTGCQSGVTVGPKLAADQVLRVMLQDQPASLDPGQTQYTFETAVLRAVAEPLLRPRPDLSGVQPAAAESYDVNASGTAYVFHLRADGRYWDGTPVRAQDFVYAWQRLIDPRLAAPDETLFANDIVNGEKVALMDPQRDKASIGPALQTLGLKAVDDHTFAVLLAHPDPAFVWLAALPAAAPIRQDLVQKNGDKWATSPATYLTNGPFRVTEMVDKDHIKVEPNPDYWGPKPALKEIDFEIENDGAAALDKYRSGSLDEIVVQPAQAGSVASDSSLSRQLVKTPDLTTFWIVFRVNSPPLNNVKVRQAIAQAIDREAFVRQVFQGEAMPAQTFIPKGMRGYASNLTSQRFDVAQARASLGASGLSAKQVSLTYSYDQSSDFAKATAKFVHDQLKANLGLEVNLQALDPNTLASRVDNGQFQITGPRGWTADYPDPSDWYDQFLTSSANDIAFWQNPQYDNFVSVARTDVQADRRDQEYLQAQTMLVTEAPVVFLAQTVSWYLVQPYVRGVNPSPLDEWPGALDPSSLSIAPH